MYASEGYSATGRGFAGFGDVLWWTAMTLTTMGSAYSPHSPLGKVICFAIAVYGFSVFGYVAAIFARFLVAEKTGADSIGTQLEALRKEIRDHAASIDRRAGNDRAPGHAVAGRSLHPPQR